MYHILKNQRRSVAVFLMIVMMFIHIGERLKLEGETENSGV